MPAREIPPVIFDDDATVWHDDDISSVRGSIFGDNDSVSLGGSRLRPNTAISQIARSVNVRASPSLSQLSEKSIVKDDQARDLSDSKSVAGSIKLADLVPGNEEAIGQKIQSEIQAKVGGLSHAIVNDDVQSMRASLYELESALTNGRAAISCMTRIGRHERLEWLGRCIDAVSVRMAPAARAMLYALGEQVDADGYRAPLPQQVKRLISEESKSRVDSKESTRFDREASQYTVGSGPRSMSSANTESALSMQQMQPGVTQGNQVYIDGSETEYVRAARESRQDYLRKGGKFR